MKSADLENEDKPEHINQDHRKCIDNLRCYFMQKGNPLLVLDTCADFVNCLFNVIQSIKKSGKGFERFVKLNFKYAK